VAERPADQSEAGQAPEPVSGGAAPGEGQPSGAVDDRPERDLSGELAAMEDRYLRAAADLENYRRRSARDTERRVAEALERVTVDWLEVVDSVERALMMSPDPQGPEYAGLRALLDQMEGILARHRVERLGAPGEPFDPERHEGVRVETRDDVPDQTVVDVARSGYAIEGRVLRPAQVVVARRSGTVE
jgi:molecular chaperone GrpE